MPELQTYNFSLDGLGVYSICARLLYSGKTGSEVICDSLEQAWVLALWECAIHCETISPSHDIRGAISAIATSHATARRSALDLAPVEPTSFKKDLDIVRRTYSRMVHVALHEHAPNSGITREDSATVISHMKAISHNVSLALSITDDIVRESTVSGSKIMELTRKATQNPQQHVPGRPVEGIDDTALDSASELAPWLSALNRIKHYQDKRMTLDEFLDEFGFKESKSVFQVREDEQGLPRLFHDDSYSRISGSELLVFESTRWISFKFHGSVLNFQKTNRAVSCRMGTAVHPPAGQSAGLPRSREHALTGQKIKEALDKLGTHQATESKRLYELTLGKVERDDEKEEDIKKQIMFGVQIKQVGDRMGITYGDAYKRIGSAARISCVTFNALVLEDDVEFQYPSQHEVESLVSDADYSQFRTASELDSWFDNVLKKRGVFEDQKKLRDMLRAQAERLMVTKFDTVQVTGPQGSWARLYQLSSTDQETTAEYFADLPHMITSKTTLEADASGTTQRGLVAVRTGAKMWHIKASSVEPGLAVLGRIEFNVGDYIA